MSGCVTVARQKFQCGDISLATTALEQTCTDDNFILLQSLVVVDQQGFNVTVVRFLLTLVIP